eukprot:scaffold570_cov382-Prasinococcus_capsulatus_cf.AAC.2
MLCQVLQEAPKKLSRVQRAQFAAHAVQGHFEVRRCCQRGMHRRKCVLAILARWAAFAPN